MKPLHKNKFLSQFVHDEFEKYATVLREAMPNLEKLVVSKGFFGFKTTRLLPPVSNLELHSLVD